MKLLQNYNDEEIRLTDERFMHIEDYHPEMKGQIERIKETLKNPETIHNSKSDSKTQLSL